MNKEKLVQVRERITELGGDSTAAAASAKEEEKDAYVVKRSRHDGNKHQHSNLADANQHKPKLKKRSSIAATAVVIQNAFRSFRARCHLSDQLTKTYQRVLHPASNQYYYYNRVTKLSQWETPLLLHRCHDAIPEFASKCANSTMNINSTSSVNAAAMIIQAMFRQRSLRIFVQDLKRGNLEKVFDAGFGAWYYFNARTNRSFWENVHHVRLTATKSAIYHRHQVTE
ncbi:FKBP-type peptidyl-prolyl cis-trans isomerase [Phytophthora megakarya]|uniref:FKBP-type peptidyl-prolyl cis-trans isomerase n=1 Tax=Phytophthora megakarya TaxID=4795 RepID=A0A225WQY0_9STRA|nr:FKBP-type peptidyl-prolyl cis-trans isomerase [Phytophthora megakarya]